MAGSRVALVERVKSCTYFDSVIGRIFCGLDVGQRGGEDIWMTP